MTSSLGLERGCAIKLLEEESPDMGVSMSLVVEPDEMVRLEGSNCEVKQSPEESSTHSNHFCHKVEHPNDLLELVENLLLRCRGRVFLGHGLSNFIRRHIHCPGCGINDDPVELKLSAWCNCFLRLDGDVEISHQCEETIKAPDAGIQIGWAKEYVLIQYV